MFIVVENHSGRTDLTPEWLAGLAEELTEQLGEFVALYGLGAWSVVVDPSIAPSDSPRLALLPTSDVADAAGYHDKDPKGRAYGRAFTEGSSLEDVSETCSHEVLEMVGNLEADRFRQSAVDGRVRAEEACDAVEGSPYRGKRGYRLANFVTPSWYVPEMGPPFDRCGVLRSGLTRLKPPAYIIESPDGVSITTDPPMASTHGARGHATSRLSKIQRHAARAADARLRARTSTESGS